MNRTALRIVSVLALIVLSSVWLYGQAESGTISGIVTDSSNAVVAGAKVTVVSANTGLTRSATTASAGEYAITNLKTDSYNLTTEHTGLSKYARQVKVDVGAHVEVSAQLSVTGVSTTVEVTASGETAAVNTESKSPPPVATRDQI